jgi:hypothetical protein
MDSFCLATQSALTSAVEKGKLEAIKWLLSNGVSVTKTDIQVSVLYSHWNIIEFFIDMGFVKIGDVDELIYQKFAQAGRLGSKLLNTDDFNIGFHLTEYDRSFAKGKGEDEGCIFHLDCKICNYLQ